MGLVHCLPTLLPFEKRDKRVGRENRRQWVAKHQNTKAFTSCSVFKRLSNNKHIQLHKTGEAEKGKSMHLIFIISQQNFQDYFGKIFQNIFKHSRLISRLIDLERKCDLTTDIGIEPVEATEYYPTTLSLE